MSYRVLPPAADVDEQTVQQMVEWCKANGIDATKIPAPAGDPGFGLQIHGDTIRFREYVMNDRGEVERGLNEKPRITQWGERQLLRDPAEFGITTVKVRA
jgi:hypothetical protein